MPQARRVVIVGGGAGGLIAANMLARERDVKVTLLNDTPYHYYLPQLLQIAFRGDDSQLRRPLDSLVRSGVELLLERAARVNLAERSVETESGRPIPYDYLILAPGLTVDHSAIRGNEPLASKFGDFHSTPENAWRVHSAISGINKGRVVVAVADPKHRCPPSPYEAVLLADEALRARGVRQDVSITLAVPYPRAYPSESFNEVIEPVLRERGIAIETFFTVDSVDVEGGRMTSLEGGELQFDVGIVVPMHKGPRLSVLPEGTLDEDGFVKADRLTNAVNGYDDAFAIGDASTSANARTGVTAHLQAEVVVKRLRGEHSVNTGRTNCPTELGFGMGTFVISDYQHPAVKLPPMRVFFLMKRMFADMYWDMLKYPEFWNPIFESYLEATEPGRLSKIFG